jgi:hypothetical protein
MVLLVVLFVNIFVIITCIRLTIVADVSDYVAITRSALNVLALFLMNSSIYVSCFLRRAQFRHTRHRATP